MAGASRRSSVKLTSHVVEALALRVVPGGPKSKTEAFSKVLMGEDPPLSFGEVQNSKQGLKSVSISMKRFVYIGIKARYLSMGVDYVNFGSVSKCAQDIATGALPCLSATEIDFAKENQSREMSDIFPDPHPPAKVPDVSESSKVNVEVESLPDDSFRQENDGERLIEPSEVQKNEEKTIVPEEENLDKISQEDLYEMKIEAEKRKRLSWGGDLYEEDHPTTDGKFPTMRGIDDDEDMCFGGVYAM